MRLKRSPALEESKTSQVRFEGGSAPYYKNGPVKLTNNIVSTDRWFNVTDIPLEGDQL